MGGSEQRQEERVDGQVREAADPENRAWGFQLRNQTLPQSPVGH